MAKVESIGGSQHPNEVPVYHELLAGKESHYRTLPLGEILTDNAIVDLKVLSDLKRLRVPPPIIVRANTSSPQESTYNIISGFHSAVAAKEKKLATIDAHVYPFDALSDDDVAELRLNLAIKGNPSLKTARIATTLLDAFEQTPFAQKGVTIMDAFSWTRSNIRQGSRTGDLTKQEVESVKMWTRRMTKATEFQLISLMSNIIAPATKADRTLLQQVRNVGPGKRAPQGVATPDQLKVIALAFPYEYELQKRLLKKATDAGLSKVRVQELVDTLLVEQSAKARSPEGIKERWLLEAPVSAIDTQLEGKPKEVTSIPVHEIRIPDDDIVDQSHIAALKEAIKEERRLPTIKVAAINTDGQITYHLFDGAHTLLARQGTKHGSNPHILARVYSDISPEEFDDLRLRAAADGPRSLRYVRFFTILNQAYERTQYAQEGVSLTTVLGWAGNDTPKDPPTLYEPAKEWIRERAQQCEMKPISIYSSIFFWATKTDPAIVRQVRNGTVPSTGELTVSQIQAIIDVFGHQYEIQRLLAPVVAAASMTTPDVKTFMNQLRTILPAREETHHQQEIEAAHKTIADLKATIREIQLARTTAMGHASRSADTSKRLRDEIAAIKQAAAEQQAADKAEIAQLKKAQQATAIELKRLQTQQEKNKLVEQSTLIDQLAALQKERTRLLAASDRDATTIVRLQRALEATKQPTKEPDEHNTPRTKTTPVTLFTTAAPATRAEQEETTTEEQAPAELSTALLLDHAQNTFYFIPPSRWDTLVQSITYTNGQDTFSGEAALENSLVPRLKELSEKFGWNTTGHIIKFLSAAHINHYAQRHMKYSEKVQMQEVITKKKDQFQVMYTDLLQYFLYTESQDDLSGLIQRMLTGDITKGAAARTAFRQFNALHQNEGLKHLFDTFTKGK